MPVFLYRTEKGEEGRKSISLSNISWNGQPRGGDVFISSALKPFPRGQDQDVSLNKGTMALRQAIMCRQNPFREQKAMGAKVKVNRSKVQSDFVLPVTPVQACSSSFPSFF